MKSLVVYDSFFGNTEKVAKFIGEGLSEKGECSVKNVKELSGNVLDEIDLLVVGSPTRAFKPTKDISQFMKSMDLKERRNIKIAIFDTRINIEEVDSKLLKIMESRFGYAIDTMEKILNKKSESKLIGRKPFYVLDSEGPLADKEEAKAKDWADELSNLVK